MYHLDIQLGSSHFRRCRAGRRQPSRKRTTLAVGNADASLTISLPVPNTGSGRWAYLRSIELSGSTSPKSHTQTSSFPRQLSSDAVYRYESSKVLINVMRDYQPIWRIRSRMSPL